MTAPPADNFPFEIVETTGENALAQWEELKAAGPRGAGGRRGYRTVSSNLSRPHQHAAQRPVQEALAAANAIRFPEGLFKMRRDEKCRERWRCCAMLDPSER